LNSPAPQPVSNKQRVIEAEVYSRVSGYFRPVNQWNIGKKEEFATRKFANGNTALEDLALKTITEENNGTELQATTSR
jgi:hypothetical protein